ncbi:MAG: hypothetical protein ACFFFG_07220 [Candidatus Thorarchaeota archaeon]
MPDETGRSPLVEYSKSGRAGCRGCREKIEKGAVRIGIPSTFSRGNGQEIQTYQYYHPRCLLPDQMRKYLDELRTQIIPLSMLSAADKKQALVDLEDISTYQDQGQLKPRPPYFEISKSGRGKCHECRSKIEKGIIRVVRREGEVQLPDGRQILGKNLYHTDCFFRTSSEDPVEDFKQMADGARKKAILTDDQIKEIESTLKSVFDGKTSAQEFLNSIGSSPITLNKLKKLAQNKGLDFGLVEDVIKGEAEKGKIFISGNTIQRL